MTTRRRKKVLAAMSGGVDSSVAAALLKKKGYDVIGITMQIWPLRSRAESRGSGLAPNFGGCCGISAVEDAKKVAKSLKIPHYVLNFREEFKKEVVDDFISEYRRGRTPNPCVICNQKIKFDLLINKADELGADHVATGHYASIVKNGKSFELKKGSDKKKDQSYFLYSMGKEALPRVLFPVGDTTKTKTRQIAKQLGLSIHDKKDSQEICFIEDNNYGRFLSDNIPGAISPGPIYNTEGVRVGMHKGIIFYTIGQRKGLGVQFGKPCYVLHIDPDSNSIVVGEEKYLMGKELIADNVKWLSIPAPKDDLQVKAKIRYNSEETEAKVVPLPNNECRVVFKSPVKAITPGQSVVFYKNNVVLGGAIIKERK
ncbi:MAG: tRNA 2-thiouridine(34) synthase MnmA [Candidatus Margulisiibacteriota bacterium]